MQWHKNPSPFTMLKKYIHINALLYTNLCELSMQPFAIHNPPPPSYSFNDFPLVIARSTLN